MVLTAEVLEGFVRTLLMRGFDNPAEIPECHREWWRLCCSKEPFVAIAAPRHFAKSTAITFSYALASLLFRERSYLVIVSDTETQAVMFLQTIKKEVTENEELVKLFGLEPDPKLRFAKDTEVDIIVRFKDGTEFRVVAKGTGNPLRGIKWGSKRPDLIICDDMENDEIVLNKERREKAKRWFTGALLPMKADHGIIRIVGTILHADSLLESFMPKPSDRKIVVEPLKTWSRGTLAWKAIKYRGHSDDFKYLLWPAKWSEQKLKSEREKFIQLGLADVWSQEILNIPLDPSRAIFQTKDFLEIKDADLQKPVNYYVGCDFATGEKQTQDFSVFTIGAVDCDNILQIRKVIRERMDPTALVDTILMIQETYDPVFFAFEKGTILKMLLPFLHDRMQETGIYVNYHELASTTDKVARCRSIQGRMRVGGVKFFKDEEWYPAFQDEMLTFPRGNFDDQVDSLSILGLSLNKFATAPTPEEIEEEIYYSELEHSGIIEQGRSEICGY